MSKPRNIVKRSKSDQLTKPIRVPNLRLQLSPTREETAGVLEELIQCGICLEKLLDPRMLPCQHTFCLSCLRTQSIAKNLVVKSEPNVDNQLKLSLPHDIKYMNCPICQQEILLEKGLSSLADLPKNLYIDSVIKLLSGSNSPVPPRSTTDYLCVKCQIISEQQEHVCQHCTQVFCEVCWNDHISELNSNLSLLTKQINESETRLKHKAESFSTRCDKLNESIKETVQQKIQNIQKVEKSTIGEVNSIKEQGRITYENINGKILELKDKIEYNAREGRTNGTVTTYMNLHRETAKLLNEVYHYGEARLIFDPETFKLDQDTEGIYNEIEETNPVKPPPSDNPFESVSAMAAHYRSRSFVPKLLWTKCPRPGGVGIPPWDTSKIYVTTTDNRQILILDRSKFRLVGRISNPEMLFPTSLAFSKTRKEIFVADRWKHCVHVFSSTGEYLRNICSLNLTSPEGIEMGPNEELIICDTGNDRVLVVNSETEELISVIGRGNRILNLATPTSVAVYGANVIVADTGNHRIKIFNIRGDLLDEFGSLGRNQGQFRSIEVVAVDSLGFIFVGDAGNARIQVFKPDGTLIKIFGSKQGFGWVSGIYITPELDIITTDAKARSLRIF